MIRMMIAAFLIGIILISCNRTYEKAIKSDDPTVILSAAEKMYNQEKWPYAVELYQKAARYYVGTDTAELIAYKNAYANFYDKSYRLAANQFKNFSITYPQDERADESSYMSAFCYYQGSPDYNLDQTNTVDAIKELQNYIDTHPNSEKVKEANALIDELREKLDKKAFEIAKSYYKTLEYNAAAVAFANYLDDFPDTKRREKASIYLVRAKSQLALKSRFDKKKLRLQDAKTAYRLFTKNYSSSEYTKEAENWKEKLDKSEIEHNELLAQVEKSKNK